MPLDKIVPTGPNSNLLSQTPFAPIIQSWFDSYLHGQMNSEENKKGRLDFEAPCLIENYKSDLIAVCRPLAAEEAVLGWVAIFVVVSAFAG